MTGRYALVGYVLRNTLSDNGGVTRGICSVEDTYIDWHKEIINELQSLYGEILTEGQAQKWLNMSIKYLITFKAILYDYESEFEEFKLLENFYTKVKVDELKVPVDSKVLNTYGFNIKKWSKLDKDEYDEIDKELLNNNLNFITELKGWEDFVAEPENDKKSYKFFLKGEEDDCYLKKFR